MSALYWIFYDTDILLGIETYEISTGVDTEKHVL